MSAAATPSPLRDLADSVQPQQPPSSSFSCIHVCTSTPQRKKVTAVVIAVFAAVVATIGILATLAASGVHLGVFNALGILTMNGGMILTVGGGVLFAASMSWLVARAIQNCRSTREVPSQNSFPLFMFPPVESEPHFEVIGRIPEEFKTESIDATHPAKSGMNPRTAVVDPYPAAYISTEPDTSGSRGTAPFILAATPHNVTRGYENNIKTSFYTMAINANARCIVCLDPTIVDESKSPALLQPGQQIQGGEVTLTCAARKVKFDITELRGQDDEPVTHQFVPQSVHLFKDPKIAFAAIRTIKAHLQRHGVEVTARQPLIIASVNGQKAGAFAALWDLHTKLQQGRAIDETIAEQLLNLAEHIEEQSWKGSATKWINEMWRFLFPSNSQVCVRAFEREPVFSAQEKAVVVQATLTLVGSQRR